MDQDFDIYNHYDQNYCMRRQRSANAPNVERRINVMHHLHQAYNVIVTSTRALLGIDARQVQLDVAHIALEALPADAYGPLVQSVHQDQPQVFLALKAACDDLAAAQAQRALDAAHAALPNVEEYELVHR